MTESRSTACMLPSLCMVLVALLCWSPDVSAQDDRTTVEPSDKQMELNARGVEFIVTGKSARAVALLEEARTMGEVNIIYLNLGRAYQNIGNCAKARESFEKVMTAPAVKDPAPELVDKKAESYLGQLDEECEPDERVDKGTDESESDKTDDATVDTGKDAGGETDRPGRDADAEISQKTEASPPSSKKTWGWVAIGTGAALVGTGVALHFVAQGKRTRITDDANYTGEVHDSMTQREAYRQRDAANTLDSVGLGAMIGGAVVAGFGTYLFLSPASEPEPRVSFQIDHDAIGVIWTTRF